MLLNKIFKKSVQRITNDFKQKELLPLKLVFFVQASTISVLYPYLTIHMRELGINVEEAAIMSAVIPVIGIIMPPLAGMVADKIGNFKLLLAFFSLIGGVSALLLLLVPVGRVTVTYPERMTLNVGCTEVGDTNRSDLSNGVFELGLSKDVFCDQVSGLQKTDDKVFQLNFTKFEECGFVCRTLNQSQNYSEEYFGEEIDPSSPLDIILSGRSYAIQIKTDSEVKSYHFNLTMEDLPRRQTKEDILSHRIMANDKHFKTSIRKVAPFSYYFPASEFSGLNCRKVSKETKRKRRRRDKEIEDVNERENFICYFGSPDEKDDQDLNPSVNATFDFGLKRIQNVDNSDELNQFTSEFADWLSPDQSKKAKVTCRRSKQRDITVFVYLHNLDNNLEVLGTIPLTGCQPRCLVTTLRKSMCTNLKQEVYYDPQLTFWSYLVIRVFIGIIGSTSYAMYEVAVIAILREQKADYGLQRIYSSIGGMIASPLSGILIDYASKGKGYTDFRPAFYLYTGLKIGTSILMLFINLEFKKAASNVISDAIQVLKNLEIIALLTACFILGTAWGYIESFLFWFLEDLGGTRSLMGITITVGGIAGIPLLVLSGPIIDKIGHANVLFIGFLFYAIRLVGYSVIYNPYHCLFFEAMESITSSLAITAAVTYAAKLSTTTTDGSIQGLVGGLYFGVGRGAGSLIGGYLMNAFGTRQTYQIFAVFSAITGFIYYFFNQFYIRKRPQVEGNDICKEPKPIRNLDSDILVITQKPKEGGMGYGTIQAKNNNADVEGEKKEGDNKKIDDEGKKKKEKEKREKEKKEKETRPESKKKSHSNPAYVDDEETKKED